MRYSQDCRSTAGSGSQSDKRTSPVRNLEVPMLIASAHHALADSKHELESIRLLSLSKVHDNLLATKSCETCYLQAVLYSSYHLNCVASWMNARPQLAPQWSQGHASELAALAQLALEWTRVHVSGATGRFLHSTRGSPGSPPLCWVSYQVNPTWDEKGGLSDQTIGRSSSSFMAVSASAANCHLSLMRCSSAIFSR